MFKMTEISEDSMRLPSHAQKMMYDYKGHLMSDLIPRRFLRDMKNFNIRKDDIFLISFPKSGTTWVQHIVCLIINPNTYSDQIHLCRKVPFLEMPQNYSKESVEKSVGFYEMANEMPSPRFMKTQLPISLLPREFHAKKPKVIYVSRNAKDVAVSLFNFCSWSKNWPKYNQWSDFLNDFKSGTLPRGSWFDSVLDWWDLRQEQNVLFLKYEDLKKDLRGSVVQIAKFLERPLTEEDIDKVVASCTFHVMKKQRNVNPDYFKTAVERGVNSNLSFMRKGQVGDWRNYFTVAQNEEFDKLYEEKMKGSELFFDFRME